jgi:hypothetical protein
MLLPTDETGPLTQDKEHGSHMSNPVFLVVFCGFLHYITPCP